MQRLIQIGLALTLGMVGAGCTSENSQNVGDETSVGSDSEVADYNDSIESGDTSDETTAEDSSSTSESNNNSSNTDQSATESGDGEDSSDDTSPEVVTEDGSAADAVPNAYVGDYEEGTVCGGEQICEIGAFCCINWGVSSSWELSIETDCRLWGCLSTQSIEVSCDDHRDCTNREGEPTGLCCANISNLDSAGAWCRADGCNADIGEQAACIDDGECGSGEKCCTAKLNFSSDGSEPLDMGICFETDDCSTVTVGG